MVGKRQGTGRSHLLQGARTRCPATAHAEPPRAAPDDVALRAHARPRLCVGVPAVFRALRRPLRSELCFRCEGHGQDGSAGAGLSAHQAWPLLRPVPRHGLRRQALQLPETSGRRGEEACSRGEEEAG